MILLSHHWQRGLFGSSDRALDACVCNFIQTVQFSEGTTYYLLFLLLYCLCQLSMEKPLEFSGFL